MSLQDSWVDRIFTKLSMTYGRDFLSRWEGLELDDVKADWADELGGLSPTPDRIRYALENLPLKAPTVIEFRALAFSMPIVSMPALQAPDPAGLRRIAEVMAPVVGEMPSAREWMLILDRDVKAGNASPARKRHHAIAVENGYYGNVAAATTGDFVPPAESSLPPDMRASA